MVPRLSEQFAGTQARDHRLSARPQRRYSLEAQARGIKGRKTVKPYVRIARERPQAPRAWRPDVRSALGGAIGGAVAAYFIDPRRGRARRHLAIDRGGAALRRAGKRLDRGVHVKIAFARGHVHRLVHGLRRAPVPELDDATLAHKVESVLFREAGVPKGRISVNAERGAVFLRGEVASPDLIEELERAARRIGGVRSVENLLHQPGTLAPHSSGGALLHREQTAEHGEAG
jgi:BON domain